MSSPDPPPSPKAPPPVPPKDSSSHNPRSNLGIQKPLPAPPEPPSRFRSPLWTVVVPLTIAFYLSFLFSWVDHNKSLHRASKTPKDAPCDSATNSHCWGLTTPHGLRGEGLRDRSQLGSERATLLMLVRNRELEDALHSMRQIEDRFNRYYRYPWTFLNDEEFTEEFRNYTSVMASGEVEYGRVGMDEGWGMPEWVDCDRARESAERMEEEGILYGGSRSYRNMCRWYAGWFARHPLMGKYDWYWRVEPNIRFPCDQLYDPFTFLRTHDKSFTFTITLPEYPSTIPSLFPEIQSFFRNHPEYLHSDATTSLLPFIAENPVLKLQRESESITTNTTSSPIEFLLHPATVPTHCHFWSNFEIASLSFFRSPSYLDFFSHLDNTGNFYYERWGDAPIHTLAVATLLGKHDVHFWEDMGYWHEPWGRCPWDAESWENGRCAGCEWVAANSSDWGTGGRGWCLARWWDVIGMGEWWNEFSRFEEPLGGV